jgi:hypothetical protein
MLKSALWGDREREEERNGGEGRGERDLTVIS